MKQQQSGFTLIELIAVIVILGILAATAVPRFINLSTAAQQAAADGVAGNLGSAVALNYAGAIARDAGITQDATNAPLPIANCAAASTLLVSGLPAGYTITGDIAGTDTGATASCTVTVDGTTPAITSAFQGIRVN